MASDEPSKSQRFLTSTPLLLAGVASAVITIGVFLWSQLAVEAGPAEPPGLLGARIEGATLRERELALQRKATWAVTDRGRDPEDFHAVCNYTPPRVAGLAGPEGQDLRRLYSCVMTPSYGDCEESLIETVSLSRSGTVIAYRLNPFEDIVGCKRGSRK